MRTETRPHWRLSFAALLVAMGTTTSAVGVTGASPATPDHAVTAGAPTAAPLRILLTNDDGYDAPGIRAVHDALAGAGHDVTIVAPETNQSGSSGRLNLEFGTTLAVVEQDEGVYSVDGSPADAVLVGLGVVFAESPPDLVVSGSNFGHNSGGLVGHSGTVGAAVTAMEQGVPALAVSTEIDLSAGSDATLERFPETAGFVVRLVDTLQTTSRSDELLPHGQGLNVNYPIVTTGDGEPRGVAFTQVGDWSFLDVTYRPAGDGRYVITPTFPAFDEPVRNADTTALAQDKISVSVLDGDLGTSLHGGIGIFSRLWDLRRS